MKIVYRMQLLGLFLVCLGGSSSSTFALVVGPAGPKPRASNTPSQSSLSPAAKQSSVLLFMTASLSRSREEQTLVGNNNAVRISQSMEVTDNAAAAPLRKVLDAIGSVFPFEAGTCKISSLGVPFALSYALISQINAAITLSIAWYATCRRTGLSPLVPGQWKALLTTYGAMYAVIQILRPFRVALAMGLSKQSKELLDATQEKLNCSKGVAIVIQYCLGYAVWLPLASAGILLASLSTGVPVLAGY